MTPARLTVVVVAITLSATGCAGERPTLVPGASPPPDTSSTTTQPTSSTTSTVLPKPEIPQGVPAPDGRIYPGIPADPQGVADRLVEVEFLLRGAPLDDLAFGDLAHEQQMLYRHLGRNPEWLPVLRDVVPDALVPFVELQLQGRLSIAGIPSGDPPINVPAWRIIDPLPADDLLALYQQASIDSGIDWTFLAAINLLETGFGRIAGVSTAGAQGPMQFLPTTWEEVSDGDINDPTDAIPAAARYLVRRGGPDDMQGALWGYNNSDSYVDAVSAYAELFDTDITSYYVLHAWEIHYSSADGDLWFPVGYFHSEAIPVADHLLQAPWSAPPPPQAQ